MREFFADLAAVLTGRMLFASGRRQWTEVAFCGALLMVAVALLWWLLLTRACR